MLHGNHSYLSNQNQKSQVKENLIKLNFEDGWTILVRLFYESFQGKGENTVYTRNKYTCE